MSGERLDIGPARSEQRDASYCAPADALPQVELVRIARQAAEPGEEPRECLELLKREQRMEPNSSTSTVIELDCMGADLHTSRRADP